jgi:GTP-binding protein Era
MRRSGKGTGVDGLENRRHPLILVLNKIDLVRKPQLLGLSARLCERLNPDKVFMISAAQGEGVADLKKALAESMPPGPWLYPEDEVCGAADRMIAAELTREQVVNQLYQELPYATAVETETWEDRADGSTEIRQQILVERDSQKAIVVGKAGARLKRMATAARKDMEKLFGGKVYLEIWVKVRHGWTDSESALKSLGYD